MISRILTGLSQHEWKEAWQKVQAVLPYAGQLRPGWLPTFAKWKQGVIFEARNRQFIAYAQTGRRCSMRSAIQHIIQETLSSDHPLPPQAVPHMEVPS
jgi:hypothetical protein